MFAATVVRRVAAHLRPFGALPIGFLAGPANAVELTPAELGLSINMGGFDLLGRSAEQLRTTEQLAAAKRTCDACK